MLKVSLRRKAAQFSRLARESMLHQPSGETRELVVADPADLGLTFIGHSSFFVQICGLNLVIDPNYAQWLVLLKRLRRPGLRLRDLPAVDAVLVTHAHMDHLHKPSLRRIAYQARRDGRIPPVIIVPRNVRDLVVDLGFSQVIEIDLWQEITLRKKVHITHVPSRHWGARMLSDFHRGYGGYVLRANHFSVYHAGDTAYFDGFAEIGQRLNPEIALMPIGAYSPEPYRNVHTSPEDALRGFVEMNARWIIPMHYGTFRLSHEPLEEPVERLLSEAERLGISDRVIVSPEGITQIFRRTRAGVMPREGF